jgi:hypothetical protein
VSQKKKTKKTKEKNEKKRKKKNERKKTKEKETKRKKRIQKGTSCSFFCDRLFFFARRDEKRKGDDTDE